MKDSMEMIWHHHPFPQGNFFSDLGRFEPLFSHNLSIFRGVVWPYGPTEYGLPILGADGDEIGSGLGVVVTWQSRRPFFGNQVGHC